MGQPVTDTVFCNEKTARFCTLIAVIGGTSVRALGNIYRGHRRYQSVRELLAILIATIGVTSQCTISTNFYDAFLMSPNAKLRHRGEKQQHPRPAFLVFLYYYFQDCCWNQNCDSASASFFHNYWIVVISRIFVVTMFVIETRIVNIVRIVVKI